jgi:DNA-binding NarL/FixJ family response regulator
MTNELRKRVYCYGKGPQVRLMVESALKPEHRVVGYFSKYHDCVEKLSARPCDILIVDLEGCEEEGLELLLKARRMAPWISTLAIVERAAVATAVRAVRAGADECLEKPVQTYQLSEAVEGQLARGTSLPPPRRALTQMELQILQLILAGKTSQDIATHLHRSKRTIDVHRKNIMRKLQACSLVDLIKRALGMGLVDGAENEDCPPSTTPPTTPPTEP